MKKFLYVFLIFTFLSCGVSFACFTKKNNSVILFNNHPITEQNIMDNSVEFPKGERIYYIITMPKFQYSRKLYIQIFKQDNALGQMGYKLVWSRDVKLKNEETTYYTDYVVLNSSGSYVMQVYSKDRPTKLYSRQEFWVR